MKWNKWQCIDGQWIEKSCCKGPLVLITDLTRTKVTLENTLESEC